MKKNRFLQLVGCLSTMLLTMSLCFIFGNANAQTTVTETFTETGTTPWTVPANVYFINVECIGAGGAGGYAHTYRTGMTWNLRPTGGGGGGAYAKSRIQVVPGETLTLTVGKGGKASGNGTNVTLSNGGNSMVVYNGNTVNLAAGGKSVSGYSNLTGAAGGAISDCIGDVKYAGGKGGNGDYGSSGGYCSSGGGGGAAGTSANGGDGGDGLAGMRSGHAGAAGNGGSGNPYTGNGGSGRHSTIRDWEGEGAAGSDYGGGGGGSISTGTTNDVSGGKGADGYIRITYIECNATPGAIDLDVWTCNLSDTVMTLENTTPATGAGGVYSWQRSADNTSWSDILGATTATYDVHTTSPDPAIAYYRRGYTAPNCIPFYTTPVQVTETPGTVNAGMVVDNIDETITTYNVCKGDAFTVELKANTTRTEVAHWETSVNNTDWTDLSTTGSTYAVNIANMTQTVYYRYYISVGTDCNVYSTNVFTINALNLPVVTSITAPTDLCPGLESYDVTADITADAEITTYTWSGVTSNNNEVATINATAPACGHTYTYGLTVADENGCVSAAKTGFFTTKSPTAITVASNVEANAAASSSCTYSIPDLTTAVNEALTSECAVTVTSQTPAVGTTVAPESETNVTVNVEDACGNTLAVTVKVTAPAVAILRTDAVDFTADDITATLWYGACDTLLNIPTPTYTLDVDGYESQIVLSNNRSTLNSGAILGRVAPGTHVIVWKLSDPCGNYVEFSQNVIVNFPACGEGVTVNDADGNTYQTVRVGCECWTKSNLKSTKYSDGTEIAFDSLYTATDIPAVDEDLFGKLYTWYSAMNVAEGDNSATPTVLTADGSGLPYIQGVCPEGWAIPSASAYQQISTNANALKSTVAEAWLPGSSATDAMGFSATGAGYYDSFAGRFVNLKGETYFWSAETTSVVNGTCCVLTHTCPQGIITDKVKGQGFSVRCVKRSNE